MRHIFFKHLTRSSEAQVHRRRVKVEVNPDYAENLSKLFRLFGQDLGQKMDPLKDEQVEIPTNVFVYPRFVYIFQLDLMWMLQTNQEKAVNAI